MSFGPTFTIQSDQRENYFRQVREKKRICNKNPGGTRSNFLPTIKLRLGVLNWECEKQWNDKIQVTSSVWSKRLPVSWRSIIFISLEFAHVANSRIEKEKIANEYLQQQMSRFISHRFDLSFLQWNRVFGVATSWNSCLVNVASLCS